MRELRGIAVDAPWRPFDVLVRGLAKVTCVAFLAALAANLGSHDANLIG